MIKPLLNSVIAKYRDLSVSRSLIICLSLRLRQMIDLFATDIQSSDYRGQTYQAQFLNMAGCHHCLDTKNTLHLILEFPRILCTTILLLCSLRSEPGCFVACFHIWLVMGQNKKITITKLDKHRWHNSKLRSSTDSFMIKSIR